VTARDEVSVGCVFFGAVTIEPFEVSRWRGGCGAVYGISMGMCLGRCCFCVKSGGDSGLAIERDEEEQCRWKAAWALFARCNSKTSIGRRCVREHGGCGR
jgi:hypothetical protein